MIKMYLSHCFRIRNTGIENMPRLNMKEHPSTRHLSNPRKAGKQNWLPVKNIRIAIEESRLNHDGSPATLAPNYITRTVRTSAGKIKKQPLTQDGYVIADIKKYTRMQKEQAYTSRPSKTINENIDGAVKTAMEQKTKIDLTKAYPEIGLHDQKTVSFTKPVNNYSKEYTLRTVHRLLLQNTEKDQIAQLFDVSVRTVYNWVQELNTRHRNEASSLFLYGIVKETMSFYDEIRDIGLAAAQKGNTTTERLQGMNLALKAEREKHIFLEKTGYYGHVRLKENEMQDESVIAAKRVVEMAQELLAGHSQK